MALATQTMLSLMQKLGEATGEFLEFDTTTNITTNNYIISTTLGQYDEGEDDHFGGAGTEWWAYITEGNNAGVHRRSSDYSAASTRITVAGAALAAETAAVTCRLYRYNRDKMKNAIVRACEEIYPALYLALEDTTLITGNILPDASFEDWSSTSAMNWYTASSGTFAQVSAAGSTRNGKYAAKYTAGAGNDYYYISSKSYPRLLDLQDQSIDMHAWGYPQTANDASMTVYTINAAGSTQSLATTTANPATTWSRIFTTNQKLNDNLVEVQVRFGVTTNGQYVIFDDAMIQGRNIYEYLLPNNFRDGDLSTVYMQTKANYDPPCYDYHTFSTMHTGRELAFDIINNGTQKYLRTDLMLPTERRLRLLGNKPLETLSADTDTVTLDAYRVPLLIAKARMIFWEREAVPISSSDKGRFEFEYAKAERDYRSLLRLRMPTSARQIGV